MRSTCVSSLWIVPVIVCLLGIFGEAPGICGPLLPLEEETVFCMYYKLSGEPMEDQDIEELRRTLGRPTYSDYKPAELYVRKSLKDMRDRLLDRIAAMDSDAAFEWGFTYRANSGSGGVAASLLRSIENGIPSATPFILATVSKNGKKALGRVLGRLLPRASEIKRNTALEVRLRLVPDKIDSRFQERNIAREDVFLPIRRVVFRPVRVEVGWAKGPHKGTRVADIPGPSTM